MCTKDYLNILPANIQLRINNIRNVDKLQEIRIRIDKQLTVNVANCEIVLDYICTNEDVQNLLKRISNYSIYAFQEEMRQGYITIKGGHRVGICGSCVIENNKVKTIKDISSLNIRICREVLGCSDLVMPQIIQNNNILNTIIISPPKCGKTTLLRDITRNISDGIKQLNFSGKKTCVVDERSEICASYLGVPQLNVGLRTDVLDGCPKSQGILMAIRSMSPDIVICDEIGTKDDMISIFSALSSGVGLITSIHGNGIEDLFNRKIFDDIVNNTVFNKAIVLSSRRGVGTIEYIYDFSSKNRIWRN